MSADAEPAAEVPRTEAPEGGAPDAGPPDAGLPDAGAPDAGPDAGLPDPGPGRRFDRTSAVAGAAITALGVLLLLDRLGDLDVDFGGLWPLLAAAAGAVLLTAGLDERRRP